MLNDTRVRNAKRADRPIKLSDSGGLHLLIQPNGSKLWRLAYRFGGKQKTLAIGVYPTVTLKQTRISLGTKSTSSFKKTAGCCFITLSIAARPPRRKAACISRMVSALRA
jgi:hypothetical protein